jgi:cytosine/adenosine deaminase-related metal-dependent hydrolase
MSLVIEQARILTCDAERSRLADAALAIADGRIVAVRRDRQGHPARAVNSHTHALLTVPRCTVEDMAGADWLR